MKTYNMSVIYYTRRIIVLYFKKYIIKDIGCSINLFNISMIFNNQHIYPCKKKIKSFYPGKNIYLDNGVYNVSYLKICNGI